ncbi:hypothetical protein L6164_037085 [Bauhinia variegata]|uniref:Uncharacterized protein n=1 Tax=Bauhinia variegata TaxID=167791 RepID=A0ACB9KJ05_BAUVA|nr:hypothetical protein L6164_037085 [Bauhinia variegata]
MLFGSLPWQILCNWNSGRLAYRETPIASLLAPSTQCHHCAPVVAGGITVFCFHAHSGTSMLQGNLF